MKIKGIYVTKWCLNGTSHRTVKSFLRTERWSKLQNRSFMVHYSSKGKVFFFQDCRFKLKDRRGKQQKEVELVLRDWVWQVGRRLQPGRVSALMSEWALDGGRVEAQSWIGWWRVPPPDSRMPLNTQLPPPGKERNNCVWVWSGALKLLARY